MFLALREIRHAKLRFALITGVIVMVSSLVFIIAGLANGLSEGNTAAIKALHGDALVIGAGSDYLLDRSAVPASAAEPIGISSANINGPESTTLLGVSFFGIDPNGMTRPSLQRRRTDPRNWRGSHR